MWGACASDERAGANKSANDTSRALGKITRTKVMRLGVQSGGNGGIVDSGAVLG